VFLDPQQTPFITSFGYGTLLGVAELWRRWTWAIIRIENEQVSNLEKYRVVLDIPEITEQQEPKHEEQDYTKMVQFAANI
jgi:hypothetical protein